MTSKPDRWAIDPDFHNQVVPLVRYETVAGGGVVEVKVTKPGLIEIPTKDVERYRAAHEIAVKTAASEDTARAEIAAAKFEEAKQLVADRLGVDVSVLTTLLGR